MSVSEEHTIGVTIKLSNATLPDLPARVARPKYDRSKLTTGIVHIGLGNFHRAHQAWYLHRLMQTGEAFDWAIIGAGVRPNDAAQRQRLAEQDYLTTLIELDPAATSAEVVGSMIDFVPVEVHNTALIKQMADPAIRIVSLTVTESGYFIDPTSGAFDANHTDIQHDIANPEVPRTAFGAMIAALRIRRTTGVGPFTCLSCDNLQGNGDTLRQTILSMTHLSDPSLASWIDENCTFPNSMVDCIAPATGPKELDQVLTLGIDDAAPVTHENFRQWVIEDQFCAGRPAWEKIGAQIVPDVHDHEVMKIRLLNGGHQIIANLGEILGIDTISECMVHPLINAVFRKIAESEIAPHVKPVPEIDPFSYIDLIRTRFANPRIVDTTRRVAFDGSSRHPGFVIPSIKDGLDAGRPIVGLALAEAAWARMCAGSRENGSEIAPNDPFWDELHANALEARYDPGKWIKQRKIYGNLADDRRFADAFFRCIRLVWDDGIEAAAQAYLEERL
ncbi:mannitol dehydrogenase family protein [Planktomarina temperata]|nr:mannitol dehydrogenase family protein [Planktomarina temperata]